MLYLVIFFILTIILTVLFLIKIKIVVEYVRDAKDDDIIVSFYTLKGTFKYKYEIPLVDLGVQGFRFRLVKERGKKETNVGTKKEKMSLSEVFDKFETMKAYIDTNEVLLKNIRNYLREKVVIENIQIHIKEGTGNAFYTGILSGVLWSLMGVFVTRLSNTSSKEIQKKSVYIEPTYSEKVFNVDFFCIFHTKLVHIIVVTTKTLFFVLKVKPKIEKNIGGDFSG